MIKKLCHIFFAILILTGCVANPVTGRDEFILVGEQQEIALGQEVFPEMQKKEGGLYTKHPEVAAYVQEVGMKLAAVSDRPNLPFEFVLLDNPIPNAWTLPGGKIAVNVGLLTALESEAELAAVLAHEIVHATGRHGAQLLENSALVDLAAAAGVQAAGEDTLTAGMINIGTALVMLKYSRAKEFEADKFGIKYMSKAGYDVQAAVTLQEKFLQLSDNKDPSWLEGLFASHPPSQERIAANRHNAAKYPSGGDMGRERYNQKITSILN